MIEYWLSFATSLNPNDGKGLQRMYHPISSFLPVSFHVGPVWEQYTPRNERIIQLNGNDTIMIPDTFRKEQTDFMNSIPAVFLHRRDFE